LGLADELPEDTKALTVRQAVAEYWDDLIRDRAMAICVGPFAPLRDELKKKRDTYQDWLAKNNHLAAQKDLDGLWLLSGGTKGTIDVVVEIRGPLLREFKVDWQLERRADERFPIKKAHEIDEGEIGWLTTEPVQKFCFRFQNGVIYEITPLKVGIGRQRRLTLDSFWGNGKQAMKNRDLLPF
jgi:hypothetical protein